MDSEELARIDAATEAWKRGVYLRSGGAREDATDDPAVLAERLAEGDALLASLESLLVRVERTVRLTRGEFDNGIAGERRQQIAAWLETLTDEQLGMIDEIVDGAIYDRFTGAHNNDE